MKQTNNSFEKKQFDISKDPMINSTIFNVQTSQTLTPRVIPASSYCKEISKNQTKPHFHYSDFNETEFIQLEKLVVEKKHRYATHGNDVGKILLLNSDSTET